MRDLQQRLFGRKSERRKGGIELRSRPSQPRASRGPRRGAPGHGNGRKMLDLCESRELVALDSPQGPACGEPLGEFPGTTGQWSLGDRGQGLPTRDPATPLPTELPMRLRAWDRDRATPGLTDRAREIRPIGVGQRTAGQVPLRQAKQSLVQDLAYHGPDISPGTLACLAARGVEHSKVVTALLCGELRAVKVAAAADLVSQGPGGAAKTADRSRLPHGHLSRPG